MGNVVLHDARPPPRLAGSRSACRIFRQLSHFKPPNAAPPAPLPFREPPGMAIAPMQEKTRCSLLVGDLSLNRLRWAPLPSAGYGKE
jgi:hypothetical protein